MGLGSGQKRGSQLGIFAEKSLLQPRLEATESHLDPVETGYLGVGPGLFCFSLHLPSKPPVQPAQLQGQGGAQQPVPGLPSRGLQSRAQRGGVGLEI